jgi:hypothetical protein
LQGVCEWWRVCGREGVSGRREKCKSLEEPHHRIRFVVLKLVSPFRFTGNRRRDARRQQDDENDIPLAAGSVRGKIWRRNDEKDRNEEKERRLLASLATKQTRRHKSDGTA